MYKKINLIIGLALATGLNTAFQGISTTLGAYVS